MEKILFPPLKGMEGKRLRLASASPRRRQLLGFLDFPIEIADVRPVDESCPDDIKPEKAPEYISRKKAEAYSLDVEANEIIVTADTVVIVDGHYIGKPHGGHDAAIAMIKNLSGKTHTFVTGVTLTTTDGMLTFSSTTKVTFDTLTDDEIEYYVDHYAPMDKAGAYGIQEWIGYIGVSGIEGCYYNVMGLPLHDLYKNLKRLFSK